MQRRRGRRDFAQLPAMQHKGRHVGRGPALPRGGSRQGAGNRWGQCAQRGWAWLWGGRIARSAFWSVSPFGCYQSKDGAKNVSTHWWLGGAARRRRFHGRQPRAPTLQHCFALQKRRDADPRRGEQTDRQKRKRRSARLFLIVKRKRARAAECRRNRGDLGVYE